MVAFGSEVELVCPFTTDKDRVQAAIDRLRPVGGTRFFDAVDEALKLLEGQSGRRVLALTNGQDQDSRLEIDAPIKEARRLSLPVHTLGLGEGDDIDEASLETGSPPRPAASRIAPGRRGAEGHLPGTGRAAGLNL